MKIDISELERISRKIFFHLKKNGIYEIDVKEDFYWNISYEQRYDPYEEPDKLSLDLGQLQEDWNELKKISEGDSEPVSYALVWLSSLYRIIGEKIVM